MLNDRRKKIVRKAFNSVAKDGYIHLEDFIGRYDSSSHTEFKNGKKSRDQIANDIFVSMDDNHNGRICKREFYTYYADVSLTFVHD